MIVSFVEYCGQNVFSTFFRVVFRLIHPIIELHSLLMFRFHVDPREAYNIGCVPGVPAVLRGPAGLRVAILPELSGKLQLEAFPFLFAVDRHFCPFPAAPASRLFVTYKILNHTEILC